MNSVGEGEGGEIWENGIETCIIELAIIRQMIGQVSRGSAGEYQADEQ